MNGRSASISYWSLSPSHPLCSILPPIQFQSLSCGEASTRTGWKLKWKLIKAVGNVAIIFFFLKAKHRAANICPRYHHFKKTWSRCQAIVHLQIQQTKACIGIQALLFFRLRGECKSNIHYFRFHMGAVGLSPFLSQLSLHIAVWFSAGVNFILKKRNSKKKIKWTQEHQ